VVPALYSRHLKCSAALAGGREGEGVTQQAAALVLIVDDDRDFLEIAKRILEEGGYATVGAATGADAIEIARRDRPQLVVLDVRLRGSPSGHEVCRTLKDEIRPEPAILFVSGARKESFDRVGGLLVGADDYMVKPFASDELLARVRALLRRSTGAAAAPDLTAAELEVLRLLKDGLGQADIARRLEVSPSLAHEQIQHIFAKLGV
jgi:two-component system, OmpR family, response regulator